MNDKPLMPKATAVWLVENTTLTFKQIAEFCNLHELEIKGTDESLKEANELRLELNERYGDFVKEYEVFKICFQ